MVVLTEDFTYKYYLRSLLEKADGYFVVVGNFNSATFCKQNELPNVILKNLPISRRKIGIHDLWTIFKIMKCIKYYRVKKIITLMPKANLLGQVASRLSGIPNSYAILTGNIWLDKSGLTKWLLFYIERLVLVLSGVVIADSRSQYFILKEAHRKCSGKLRYVNGLAARDFRLPVIKPASENRNMVIGHVGRLDERKGTFDAIWIAKTCIDKRLNIDFFFAGPMENERLRKQLLDLTLTYRKSVSYEEGFFDFENCMNKVDILLMPSRYEGFGIAAVEAAKLGKIVIGYDTVGLKDSIVENETGHKVEINDKVAILHFLQQYELNRHKLRAAQIRSSLYARKHFASESIIINLKQKLDLI